MSGSTPFKIKYKMTDLLVAPKGTSNVLGNLMKGAVVLVVDDSDPYYFKVQLDNGLAGYVYKDAGELSQGATLSRLPSVNGTADVAEEGKVAPKNTNGTAPVRAAAPVVRRPAAAPKSTQPVPASTTSTNVRGDSAAPAARVAGAGNSVSISSAEIAVYDKPGIIGKQVSRMRRGDRATLLSDDGYFYQIQLNSGIIGYIPRYAAEKK